MGAFDLPSFRRLRCFFASRRRSLAPLADPCFSPCRDGSEDGAQEFGETLDGEFPLGRLAAGLLGYDAKDPVFSDAAPETAGDECLVFLGEARRLDEIEPESHPCAHFQQYLDF